jgi:hypothetical protein
MARTRRAARADAGGGERRGGAWRAAVPRERTEIVIEHTKKLVRVAIGSVLLLVGIALSVPGIPGPGIAVVILGLSVLSTDFEFARRWMARLKSGARRIFHRDRRDIAL